MLSVDLVFMSFFVRKDKYDYSGLNRLLLRQISTNLLPRFSQNGFTNTILIDHDSKAILTFVLLNQFYTPYYAAADKIPLSE